MAYHKSYHGVGGRIYLVPSGTNPTKTQYAVVKNWNFELQQEMSDLPGALDILDSLPSKRTLKGKLALNDFSTALVASVTSGTTVSAGATFGSTLQTTVPATPFQVTITPPDSGTFVKDLGVVDLTAGKEMSCGATSTGAAVYAVNESTGVYTFNTADSSPAHSILISYSYSLSSTGKTVEVAAAAGGVASSTYALHVYGAAGGKKYGIYIPACRIPNLSLTMAPDQWSDVSVDYTAFLDANNKLFYAYLME